MNRKKFIGLIFMMLISIFGIIGVQIVWIQKAIGIHNAIFNNTVFASLNDVARMLETNRQTEFFQNYASSDYLNNKSNTGTGSGYLSINSYTSERGNGFEININSYFQAPVGDLTANNEGFQTDNGDTSLISDTISFIPKASGNPQWWETQDQEEVNTPIQDPRSMSQDEFMYLLQNRLNELKMRGDQMMSELNDWEKNTAIDKNEVRFELQKTFLFRDINTPFEFAIIKEGVISDGYFKQSRESDFEKSIYKIPLFSDRIYKPDVVLSVVFPRKSNYVLGLGNMVWILGGSLLFSLIILATFGVSLYFIIRQKKISEMKSDFINNMTHEFKTPIATISLAADTITNPKVINDESGIRHFIGMIKKENSRMNKQVETILQIASLDKKDMDFVFEDVSIHTIIERSVETIGIHVTQKEGSLNLRLEAENPVVFGDAEHLTNLIHNLLDNANKYSPEKPEINVSTKNIEKGILISVEDKGIGMTKAVQGKIFERFYRQATGNIHNVKGFGLGLSYVKAIVEAHKGTINVTSEPGVGSRFEIYLPFKSEN